MWISTRWYPTWFVLTLIGWVYILLASASAATLSLHEPENAQPNQHAAANPQQSGETLHPATGKEGAQKPAKQTELKWYENPQWVLVGITAFYVLATIVYAVFAGLQWRAIREQARIANRNLILAYPPKLVVSNISITAPDLQALLPNDFLKPMVYSGQLYVENVGRTPARIVEAGSWVIAVSDQLPMRRPYEGREGNATGWLSSRDLRPGDATTMIFNIQSEQIEGGRHTLQAMQDAPRDTRLYIMGWIRHVYSSGIVRRIAFCRIWNQIAMNFEPVDNTDYEHDEEPPQKIIMVH